MPSERTPLLATSLTASSNTLTPGAWTPTGTFTPSSSSGACTPCTRSCTPCHGRDGGDYGSYGTDNGTGNGTGNGTSHGTSHGTGYGTSNGTVNGGPNGNGPTPNGTRTPRYSAPPTPISPRVGLTPAAGAAPPPVAMRPRPRPLKESMSSARLCLICAGIWSSNFAFAFQSTAIPTLAPTISSAFQHAELASYLGSVFTLGNTAGIPVYGVLIDTLGRRFAMLTACTFFASGSVACALAPDMYALIAARALSGLGGGGLLTVSAVILTDLVDLRERGFYQGIMMTVFGIGAAIGGPLSGLLADTYGWRFSFWVQAPIVLWCAFVVGFFLPEPPIAPTHASAWSGLASLDWLGSGLLLGSVGALILGLSFHTSFFRPWSDPCVWGLLVAALTSIVAFTVVEHRVKRPLIPLKLFRSRQLVAIWTSGTLLSIASQAYLFHVPTYFAVLLDSTGAEAGMVVSVCSGIGLSTGSLFAGYHIRRGGRYTWLGVLALVPTIASAFVATRWNPSWPWWGYYATVLPTNIGYAIFLCVTLIALISTVDAHTMPKATALLYTVRSLGSTLGVSLGGSIQVGALVSQLRARLSNVSPPLSVPQREHIIDAVVHSKAAIRTLPPQPQQQALLAYASSLRAVWVAAGVVAVGTLVSAVFIRQNDVVGKKADDDE